MPKKTAKKLHSSPKKGAAHKKASSKPKRVIAAKHTAKQSAKHSGKHSTKPKKTAAAPKESLFERLLREKKERSEKLHEARAHQANHFSNHGAHSSSVHFKFSKFAGPRRRVA